MLVLVFSKMIVANSFDLWQKDTFFSAAEEVQESADVYASPFLIFMDFSYVGIQESARV